MQGSRYARLLLKRGGVIDGTPEATPRWLGNACDVLRETGLDCRTAPKIELASQQQRRRFLCQFPQAVPHREI
jgi:hypothetical protein